MAFRSVGINHPQPEDVTVLAANLERLKAAGTDFVELWLQDLGIILGGALAEERMRPVREALLAADLAYTVHAPLEVNLMDLTTLDLQRAVLETSVRFASRVGAEVVVCHAGQRDGRRDALFSFKEQLDAEIQTLRVAGDLAGELGVTIAVENYYPDSNVLHGSIYDYSVRPSELAQQVADVDHAAVGICLDVGHAALAANASSLDLFEECAAAAPLVRHLHLHDNLGRMDARVDPLAFGNPTYGFGDLHLPPGQGSLPLEELLRRINFTGRPSCCVELSPGFVNHAGDALQAARNLAELAAGEKAIS